MQPNTNSTSHEDPKIGSGERGKRKSKELYEKENDFFYKKLRYQE
jgi:hypothetical protein